MTHPRLVGNRYELRELIGYGGMAEVHRGKDVRLGREVAIKVLRADLARDQTFLTRFRREAQSAAGLNHPAIVAVYDTGEEGGGIDGALPYIVMEYVEGRTLRDVLKNEGRLPIRRAMEIVSDICGALDFSHRNGIVHRDIKPANVMITDTGAVKVMDFGIARALSDNAATVTATAAVIGTAQYLSPEQARGESVDARSDVYSTGCLLYELVTGQPPFSGDSPVAVAYQHVRETAPAPSTINPEVPPALDSIVMKALAKNPLNRYQTAGEMRADLQRALADRPVEAEAVMTDADRTQIIARAGAVPRSPIPPGGGQSGDEDGGRRGAIIWTAVVVALLLVIGGAAYAIVAVGRSDKPVMVVVPNLIGQDPASASRQLTALGLTPPAGTLDTASSCGVDAAHPNTSVTVGKICTQSLAPLTKQRKGTVITYTVYAVPNIQVPSVIGDNQADATNTLAGAHLKPTILPPVSNSAAAGTVLSTEPAPGATVAQNSVVKITVSSGKITVPSVVGQTKQNALQTLNKAGWANVTATATTPVTDPAQNNLVQEQSPVGNTQFDPSTQISLTIGVYTKPKPTCTTPPPTPTTSTSTGAAASTTPGGPTGASTTPGAPSTTPATSTSSTGLPPCTS
jgi:eukaryotic-like serine/threonine-protein kinase